MFQTLGNARHLGGIREHHRERLGRIEDVIAEARTQLRELGLDLVEPRARRLVEAHPGMLRLTKQGFHDALLCRVQRRELRAGPKRL